MTRKKVKLVYITNDSVRKATFKKRKKGLLKKVSELSTLCGIDACAIVYSPYESQPEVWPSATGVQRVLSKFRKIPEIDQSKKTMDQESFLTQRIEKTSDQLQKQCKENREHEMTQVMFQNLDGKASVHGLNIIDLNDLGWLIDQNLKEIEKRVDLLRKASQDPQGSSSSSSLAAVPSVMPEATLDSMQRQQWILEQMNNNPESHVGFGAEEMMLKLSDEINVINNSLCFNAYFPWEK